MPQFHRSVAFSNKKKKEQLKIKRERKRGANTNDSDKPSYQEDKSRYRVLEPGRKITYPSSTSSRFPSIIKEDAPKISVRNFYVDTVEEINGGGDSNRYNLKFRKIHKDSSTLRKLRFEPIVPLQEQELEVSGISFYPEGLDYPKRPPWKKNISKEELDMNENRSFRLFCEEVHKNYDNEELSLYELNLETWRQLWRVTEMSDIVLIIVDARFVAAQFPPYLYKHLVEKQNKGVILILNKCDLIPPSLVLAWQDYCQEHYPKLLAVPFSSVEGITMKKSTMKMAMHSSLNLVDACQKLVDENIDLNPWRRKVKMEMQEDGISECQILDKHNPETTEPVVYQRYKDNILTIGTIGCPNVGKSSLINALMGKKVVSVSKTPGHTKHFQTIFITKDIKLCDCPGLVFPSFCPKQLQVILGSYPIAQTRDPMSSIHYIACRIDMPSILKLSASDIEKNMPSDFAWTPFYICEAWAKKRGYFTKRGGRPDVSRAANELLRFTLIGLKSLTVALRPAGYSKLKEKYSSDKRLQDIALIQGLSANNIEIHRQNENQDDVSQNSDSDESTQSVETEESEDEFEVKKKQNKFALLSLLDLDDCM